MKKLIAAGMISLLAFQSTAGTVTYEPPVVVDVIEEQPMGGSGAWIIPLVIVAVLALALTQESTPSFSDRRLKADITPIGTAPNGLPLYSFRYIGFPQVFSGVMAQDVLSHTPEAVIVGPLGYMAVDYGMLGLEMQRLN